MPIQNKDKKMKKLSDTMKNVMPRREFVAENKEVQTEGISPCPKSLDVTPNNLLDADMKVLKFEAFVNEHLNKKDKENKE